MKKYFIASNLMALVLLGGCATTAPHKERVVASKEYECRFSETIGGEKTDFVFNPNGLKLQIIAPKAGTEVVFLEEDNFISGGFTYAQAAKKATDWDVSKIEFLSFTTNPKVTVDFKRTPASKKMTVTKFCSL